MTDKAEKKELTNNEFNEKVFADIKKLEDKVIKLKDTLKPIELVQNTSLAECNKRAKKNNEAIRAMRNVRKVK